MSCYDCAEKFSFFKKEVGCANCGFGFCSKCCSQKTAVPRKENKVLAVCRNCYKKLNEPSTDTAAASNKGSSRGRSPPANFLKLVEQNSSKQDASLKGISNQSSKSNVTDPTRALEERLMKLKERPDNQNKPIPSDDELASRLRQVQGTNPEIQKLSNLPGKQIVNSPEDLIKQFTEEVDIEKKHGDFEKQEIEKLEQRLRNLSEGIVSRKPEDKDSERAHDESKDNATELIQEGSAARASSTSSIKGRDLVNKFLAEAENEYRKKNVDVEDDEEMWCCLCNGDAQFKCIDCENDYYCKRCYKQTHDTYEYKHHRRQQVA